MQLKTPPIVSDVRPVHRRKIHTKTSFGMFFWPDLKVFYVFFEIFDFPD